MNSLSNLSSATGGEESCTVDFVNSLPDLTGKYVAKTNWNDLFDLAETRCRESGSMGDLFDSSYEDLTSELGFLTTRTRREEVNTANPALPTRYHAVTNPKRSESTRDTNKCCKSSACTIKDRDELSMTPDLRVSAVDCARDSSRKNVRKGTENNWTMHSGQHNAFQEQHMLGKGKESVKQTIERKNLPTTLYVSDLSHDDDDTQDKPDVSDTITDSCIPDTMKDVPPRQVKRALSSRYVYRKQNSFATVCSDALELYAVSMHSVATDPSATERNGTTTMAKPSHRSTARRGARNHQKLLQRTWSVASSSWINEVSSLGMADDDFYLSEEEGDDNKPNHIVQLEVDMSCIDYMVQRELKEEEVYLKQCCIEDFVPKHPMRQLSQALFHD